MKRAVQNVENYLLSFQGQVFAACRMGAWCFDEHQGLYISTSPNQEEYHAFLRADDALATAIGLKAAEPVPHIIAGRLGLVWIAEWIFLASDEALPFLVMLGPIYLKNTSFEQTLHALGDVDTSPELRRRHLAVLEDVPVMSYDMARQYACMLHSTAYQESVVPASDFPEAAVAEESKISPERRANSNDFERMAAYEEMLLHHLAEGTPISPKANQYEGELQDFGLKDPLRQVKDNLIIFTSQCARTAAKSGVHVSVARTLENEWIRRIEDLQALSETQKLRQNLYNAFLRQIHQSQEISGLSRAVRDCRSYIQSNYMNDFSLEDIARHCGYAGYYLSRKFSRETGMKIGEYIHRVRVDAAKIMLVTTSREIQDISDSLRFGNRSHFDRVFRQLVGMSPARFREQGGQGQAQMAGK